MDIGVDFLRVLFRMVVALGRGNREEEEREEERIKRRKSREEGRIRRSKRREEERKGRKAGLC